MSLETNITDQDLTDAAREHAGNLAKIDKEFGDIVHYDRRSVEIQARQHLANSALSMLEAGKCLILLKEHEPHGEFMQSLERIGIGYRIANTIMKTAVKFEHHNVQTFAHLNVSKIYELALLDDEQLDALDSGGTVAGLQLDDIDRMSVRELKRTLREGLAAKDAVIAQNNRALEEQAKQLNRLQSLPAGTLSPPEYERLEWVKTKLSHGLAEYELLLQSFDLGDNKETILIQTYVARDLLGALEAEQIRIDALKSKLSNFVAIQSYNPLEDL